MLITVHLTRFIVAQGYKLGAYDVLFATNVLHATRDMGNTLQHCKALLRKGGLLIANELSTKTEFLTLTFGLTDGWWLYDDVERRIPGSPILSRFADPLLVPNPASFCECFLSCPRRDHCRMGSVCFKE